ncbi:MULTISPECIES: caspase family protein [unclassified Bradyrhizobium]|uniref:caspase family protein n=1 Tax=unclassified Bradyrhizobium TaxID=2631580 RepID=UPI0028E89744|nr:MULTISPECIES: caspase family protein [unclassified Bradyrhizobium]
MFERGRALVIGVADYTDAARLPDAVVNDARDITSVLLSPDHCGFLPANVRTLTDDDATLAGLRASLTDLARSADPDDTVLIFFSGHGGRFAGDQTSFLMPIDFRADDPHGTVLMEEEFSDAFAAIPSRRLLVLIDACHAAGAGTFKSAGPQIALPGLSEKALRTLAHGNGRVVIASSRMEENSHVLPGARNSVFTDKILEALTGLSRTGSDGVVRVLDLFNYVAEHVNRTMSGLQHPVLRVHDLDDNFPIALTCAEANIARQSLHSPRDLEVLLPDLYPLGPTDQDIWLRAGGDLSLLKLNGTGKSNWFSALRALRRGGGGRNVDRRTLIAAALADYPKHSELLALNAGGSNG